MTKVGSGMNGKVVNRPTEASRCTSVKRCANLQTRIARGDTVPFADG